MSFRHTGKYADKYSKAARAAHAQALKDEIANLKLRYPKPKRHQPLAEANKAKAIKAEEKRLLKLAYTRIEQAQDAMRYGTDDDVRLAIESADNLLECLLLP
ncbi:hypothetical protein HF285_09900 [Acidithiobacillus ferrooxidans F221]|uniref:hypothetical protein n=1 Tax=Acidithiobacillus ferrooxidans TaxID=920 RepID=UPI001C06ED24|nr:hypothetical protein [Acidithiobacillus ferrooxidans]MBU2808562.1 hypothetical protein [Acidithiobacillus ferrooxidans F221]